MKVRIGTRGSDLALWQARYVAARLAEVGVDSELIVLETRGDRIDDVPLQSVEGKAFFTAEIEAALLERRTDLAVHSHKDLPTESPPGLVIAAVPPRANPGERLLVRPEAHDERGTFLPLAHGARVGTSSPRRAEQLTALRPDLEIGSLRGNVPTRVNRLREGRHDAIVLASAGLDRLELDTTDLVAVDLALERLVPAPAQGALAIQVREDDEALLALCASCLHDPATARAVAAERTLLVRAGGGCSLPLGVSIREREGAWHALAFLGANHPSEGFEARWAEACGADPESAARALLEQLERPSPTGTGPLTGLAIALTGSAGGETVGGRLPTRLGARLAGLGAEVSHERVIEFEDLEGVDLAGRLAALRPGDALALTSRQAARRLGEGLVPPAGVVLAAVGSGTARVLRARGLEPSLVGTGGARELARALELAPGARVLFPCAVEARRDLEQELAARGLEVERLPLYRTLNRSAVQLDPEVDLRLYMSPSSVAAALEWEREHPARSTRRVALGRATREALDAAGLPALEPAAPDGESLVALMAHLAASARAADPERTR